MRISLTIKLNLKVISGSSYFLLIAVNPMIPVITTRAMKIKNITFAMEAAASATPPNPNIAAISAITRNTAVHFNMTT